MSEWFEDGTAVNSIPVDDRAAQYGDGLFETIAIRAGAPRLWQYHVERLQLGCDRLGIAAPAATTLRAALDQAIAATSIDTGYATAKLVVSTGVGERGYARPAIGPTIRTGMYASATRPAADYRSGVAVRLCNTRLASQPQLAGIKTLNRLEQVLARAEWQDAAIAEGLTLDTDGHLICGTMSNVFVGINNQLVTPALTHCGVAGVMRRHVLTEFEQRGVTVAVRNVPQAELADIDEMFLTNSQFGVLPVSRFDGRNLAIGALTTRAMSLAAGSGIEEYAR